MSTKIMQIALFTANQLALAIAKINAHLHVKIDVVQNGDELFYVIGRTDCSRCSLPLKCSETTAEQLTNSITQLFWR